MKKVLIAVDDTKGSRSAFSFCTEVCSCINPSSVGLVYVEKFEGRSLMDEMLGEAEMSTLREVLEGTEYQEALDRKAETILSYYKKLLEDRGISAVKTIIRKGHPAEEIIRAAREEGSDMILIGSRGKRHSPIVMGSVSREVINNSDIPVLVVK